MSVSTALATSAAIQSAAAAAEAHRAAVTACTKYVNGYAHDTASVAEMRQYASCVETLYPAPLTPDTTWALKVVILLVFAGMVVGGVRGHANQPDYLEWWERYVMYPLIGGALAALAIFILAGITVGIRFLITP